MKYSIFCLLALNNITLEILTIVIELFFEERSKVHIGEVKGPRR